MAEIDFKQVLKDSGLPTTAAELDTQWKADVQAQGSSINNNNAYSPFWRVMNALVTAPVL